MTDLPPAQRLAPSISEAHFQATIIETARWHGWSLVQHHSDSRKAHKGWPDLVLGRPPRDGLAVWREPLPLPELTGRARVLFAELKSETGRVKPEQRAWLEHLHACGLDAVLWRPSDWPQILDVLACRADPSFPPSRW